MAELLNQSKQKEVPNLQVITYRGVQFAISFHAEEEASVDVLDAVRPVVNTPRQLK